MNWDSEDDLEATDLDRVRSETDSAARDSSDLPELRRRATDELPESIGPYRITGILGQGGMGVVYLGEQTEPVRRRAAVKLIRKARRSRESILRFESERHAMARLAHPNVARLYEAGTTAEDRPYFAMELVEGDRITEYCDARNLGLAQRLEIFRAVCDGVHHAHQKGILHRDLKPSNVLVGELDGVAVPKVIDFGIAKAIDEPLVDGTLLTGDVVIGTPSYLPPEALKTKGEGDGPDFDTRSDVYALGIILYELLLGVRPWAKGLTFMQTVQLIGSPEEAPTPSRRLKILDAGTRAEAAEHRGVPPAILQRRLVGELDWIVAKAIAKDRNLRYGSASELGDDIGRHLRHEPVLAGPPSLAYQARKLIRRHRAATAAIVVAAAALLVAVVGLAVGLQRARLAEAEARHEAQIAKKTAVLLHEFVTAVDPRKKGKDLSVTELLEAFEPRLEELDEEPRIQASLYATYGSVSRGLGRYEDSHRYYQRAFEIREASRGADHLETLVSINELATALNLLGRHDEAETLHRRCFEESQRVLGAENRITVACLVGLGVDLMRQSKFAEAEPIFQQTYDLKMKIWGADDPSTLRALANLAALNSTLKRYGEAETLARRSFEAMGRVYGEEHPNTLKALILLGNAVLGQGRLDEAEALLRRCLEVQVRVLGERHPDTFYTLHSLARILRDQGRDAEAEAMHRRIFEATRDSLGDEHPTTLASLNNWGEQLSKMGEQREAEKAHRLALETRRRVLGSNHPHTLGSMINLDIALVMLGETGESKTLTEDLLALAADLGELESYIVDAMIRLSDALEAADRAEEAAQCLRLTGGEEEVANS